MSRWLGYGDYKVASNSLISSASNNIPFMHNAGQSVTVRHRECLGPINGSIDFAIQYVLALNPGVKSTFPWLSGLATNFQEYEWKGLIFHYIPTSGSAISSTSAALGSIVAVTNYRLTDAPPTSKVDMLNDYWSGEVVPNQTLIHPIECSPKENPFLIHYVRSGAVSSELHLYDLGVTYFATQGQQSNYVLGDLYVTYEVVLRKPIATISTISSSFVDYYAIGSVSNTSPFGTGNGTVNGDLKLTINTNTLTIDGLVPGRTYSILMLYIAPSPQSVGNFTCVFQATGGNFINSPFGFNNNFSYNQAPNLASNMFYNARFLATSTTAKLTLTTSAGSYSLANMTMRLFINSTNNSPQTNTEEMVVVPDYKAILEQMQSAKLY